MRSAIRQQVEHGPIQELTPTWIAVTLLLGLPEITVYLILVIKIPTKHYDIVVHCTTGKIHR